MTQHEATVYKCGHCRKHYLVKHACERHEKYCPKNPNNWHACFSCDHLEKDKDEVTVNDGRHLLYTQVTFRCVKLDKYMHSFKAEQRGHSCLGETERMPLECPDHPQSILDAQEVARVLLDEDVVF